MSGQGIKCFQIPETKYFIVILKCTLVVSTMDYYDTGVSFQSDYELLLDSADRNRSGAMSIRGRRRGSSDQGGVRHGDFGVRLKDGCKHTVY